MKYLEDARLTQLTSDLTGSFLNTRGSGNGSGGVSSMGGSRPAGRQGKGKTKRKSTSPDKKNRKSPAKSPARSAPPYFAYNPEGYSTGTQSTGPSSCRTIYGRVEAYNTKRAASDKRTAFEVGERYANEMERLNKAVEVLKRKHSLEMEEKEKGWIELFDDDDEGSECEAGAGNTQEGEVKKKAGSTPKKGVRRGRSRSVDGVTFSTSVSPRMVYDKSANTADISAAKEANNMMDTLQEGIPIDASQVMSEDMEAIHAKRNLPLEGILKSPSSSSNKRSRATSFDISTGPSTFSPFGKSPARKYHAGTTWGKLAGNNAKTAEEDLYMHPLIPQPSLYQSSLSEDQHMISGSGDKSDGNTPTMVPRRLVTDLILTLNASFPDYDFGSTVQVSDFCTLSTQEAMRRINKNLGEFAATTDEGRDFLPRFWNSLDDVLGGLKECEVYSYAPKGGTGEDDPMEFLTMSMATDADVGENGMVGSDAGSDDVMGREPAGGVVFSPVGGGRIVSGDLMSGIDTSMALDLPNQVSPLSGGDHPHVTLWSMNYFFVSRNKKRIVLFACVQTMRTPQGNEDDDSDDYEYGENDLVFDEARRGIQDEDQDKEDQFDENYPPTRISNMVGVSDGKAGFSSPPLGGDESVVSVMVEDTDVDEGVDVDADGDEVDPDENDFDTGALGISVSVPSH